MQQTTPKSPTAVANLPFSAEARATPKPSASAKARPVQSVLNSSKTKKLDKQSFFDFNKPPITEAKAVPPSGSSQRATTPASRPITPIPPLFGSGSASSIANSCDAPKPGTGGAFGQPTLVNLDGSTNNPNSSGSFGSVPLFGAPPNRANPFGNSTPSRSPFSSSGGSFGVFGQSTTSNTSGFGSILGSRSTDTGGTISPLPSNLPKGTPASFTPYSEKDRYKEDVFQSVTCIPNYRVIRKNC